MLNIPRKTLSLTCDETGKESSFVEILLKRSKAKAPEASSWSAREAHVFFCPVSISKVDSTRRGSTMTLFGSLYLVQYYRYGREI